jgi:hypothetical protein
MVSVLNLNYSSDFNNNNSCKIRDRGESFDISGEENFSDRGEDRKPEFRDRRKIFLTEPEILKTQKILYSVIEDNEQQQPPIDCPDNAPFKKTSSSKYKRSKRGIIL